MGVIATRHEQPLACYCAYLDGRIDNLGTALFEIDNKYFPLPSNVNDAGEASAGKVVLELAASAPSAAIEYPVIVLA